jgi:hypothetical protein
MYPFHHPPNNDNAVPGYPGAVQACNTTNAEKTLVENSAGESLFCKNLVLEDNGKPKHCNNVALMSMGDFENLTTSSTSDHLGTGTLNMQQDEILEKILHDIFSEDAHVLSSVKLADPVRTVSKYFSDAPVSMPSPRRFERAFSTSSLGVGHRLSIDSI